MPVESRKTLPLLRVSHPGGRSPLTCKYKCDDACSKPVPNTTDHEYFGDVVARSLSRRTLLQATGVTAVAGLTAVGSGQPAAAATPAKPKPKPSRGPFVYQFEATPPVPFSRDAVTVPEGFTWKPLVKWGDPIVKGAPDFDFAHQTAAAQEKQFGYNCDYVGLVKTSGNAGVLSVNNEYTNDELMFEGDLSEEQLKIVMAAHGLSVVEVSRRGAKWRAHMGARRNRRITATTPFRMVGPAAGSPLVQTSADPTGLTVLGTFANCAGGTTPWDTTLSGEENFNGYFKADKAPADQKKAYARYGLEGSGGRGWERVDSRFDAAQEPNEPNRHGWVVEIDPLDPKSTPKKLTALGRFKHEGANVIIDKSGHAVAYMGDDERFDYMYKFVSKGRYRPRNRAANKKLLHEGDLYVAKFLGDGASDGVSDGSGVWIALTKDGRSMVPGMSIDQVLVHTRLAADKVGPTKMDRPEDVDINPVNRRVYAALTNNSDRKPGQIDEANPRASNKHGQILELTPWRGDHTATKFVWKLVLIAGDPEDPGTYFNGYDKSEVSPISCPDNVAFDGQGNLWISTDGNDLGNADAFFMMPLSGEHKGHLKQFHTVPHGAESAGPLIVDDRTVFCAVQHPGEIEGASPSKPASSFPYDGTGQPRPSVIQVYKSRGNGRAKKQGRS